MVIVSAVETTVRCVVTVVCFAATLYLLALLDCATKPGLRADNNGNVSLEVPAPYDVLRSIVSTADVPDGATWDELLDRGVVQKRVEPVRIYFENGPGIKFEHITGLIEAQILPLLASVHKATGLKFDWVHSLDKQTQ
ncbi:MAG: hypothetical protein IPK59_19475 [Rhodospirillaceae bacterium]|nr:hypothetical protein [Rhodospirillaceae bacterium]